MLRIELGNKRTTVYFEQSRMLKSGAEIRIMFWEDHRPTRVGWREKPDLEEVSSEKKIFANEIITEVEWGNRTWERFLEPNSVTLDLGGLRNLKSLVTR